MSPALATDGIVVYYDENAEGYRFNIFFNFDAPDAPDEYWELGVVYDDELLATQAAISIKQDYEEEYGNNV